jgi:hypothetical protein
MACIFSQTPNTPSSWRASASQPRRGNFRGPDKKFAGVGPIKRRTAANDPGMRVADGADRRHTMIEPVFEVLFAASLIGLVGAVPIGLVALAWPRRRRQLPGVAHGLART